jgi:DNA-binding response OmpR family regulator
MDQGLLSPPLPIGMRLEPAWEVHAPMTDTYQAKNTGPQRPLRVLIVEDHVDSALTLELLLGKMGYKVEVAHRAEDGLRLGPVHAPDVVFLDIGLPDLSGYDACVAMRTTAWGAKAFIVALTGRDEATDLIRAAHAGFDRHVGKPMAHDTLQEILTVVGARAA